MTQFTVSVLLTHADDAWVAQCLEYDIAAQGDTLDAVKSAFERTFIGQMLVNHHHGLDPLDDIPAAPQEVWDQFRASHRLAERQPLQMPDSLRDRVSVEDLRICA
jgi:hypothetical protein